MKRAYVRPTMVGERFVANEYVAACGDSGTVYNFVCNAGDKFRSYNVYYEKDNQRKYIASNNIHLLKPSFRVINHVTLLMRQMRKMNSLKDILMTREH